MLRSTRPRFADKRAFYSLPSVSASYDALRFGGPSGAHVNRRELEIVHRLLADVPCGAPLLDVAAGTGRLARYLQQHHYRVVAVDYSWPMLACARAAQSAPLVQADAFALPFASGVFAGVAALRFAFHWRDLAPLLTELRRVAAPGAPLVLDTYVWTPRARIALGARRWGGKIFTHHPMAVRAQAARLGLAVEAAVPCFLCSPYVYRRLPLRATQLLERLETAVPPTWLARVFWRFRRCEG
ncbi:MAG: class I SAM-dependent methyltransferase [Chloroflexi bacterium]|nr:class I SAM-dependent methyltransferase [Chloroflexota bacterium]